MSTVNAPVIINACLTGMISTKEKCPHVPITPEEIVSDARLAHGLGAAIVHIHARAVDQQPSWEPELYRTIFGALRQTVPDLILCATTSGRLWNQREKRAAVLMLESETRPDMASLTLGSLNFPQSVSANSIADIEYLLDAMLAQGVKPEFEVFDLGMIDYFHRLLSRREVPPPFYVNILLGNIGTAAADRANLEYLVGRLPGQTVWAATGIGRTQSLVNEWAIAMGGHVRIGLEDNIYLDPATREPASNQALIQRVLNIAERYQRQPASARSTRRQLGLRGDDFGG